MKSRVRQNQKISNILPKFIGLTHRADYLGISIRYATQSEFR